MPPSGIAIAALIIAIISLGWNVANALFSFPRVSVVLSKHVYVTIGSGSQTTAYRFRVTAINTGHSDTVLADAGLRSDDGAWAVSVEQARDSGLAVAGPDFPADLPGHGSLSWDFTDGVLPFPDGIPFRGNVMRYRPVRLRALLRRPLNTHRMYVTPYAEMKGSPKS